MSRRMLVLGGGTALIGECCCETPARCVASFLVHGVGARASSSRKQCREYCICDSTFGRSVVGPVAANGTRWEMK
jgi:hypothetical protein